MKQYKGYYIDGITFNNKEEIDSFLKAQAIKSYQTAVKAFQINGNMEASISMNSISERLVSEFGLTWEEVEEIECEAFAA